MPVGRVPSEFAQHLTPGSCRNPQLDRAVDAVADESARAVPHQEVHPPVWSLRHVETLAFALRLIVPAELPMAIAG